MNKRSIVLLFILVVLSVFAVYRNFFDFDMIKDNPWYREKILNLGQIPSMTIPINPMTELDHLEKKEIYKLRTKYVMKHPQLISRKYSPSDEVFGHIVSGITWWGIYGIAGYGGGIKSIEGPSEETRYINNPFMLVGLCENYALPLNRFDSNNPEEICPKPQKLIWDSKNSSAKVIYDYSSYLDQAYGYQIPKSVYLERSLYCYNARDFGFNYAYIDLDSTGNAVHKQGKPVLAKIPFFIHKGGSSGYPGGSNNGSPAAPAFDIKIVRFPVNLKVRLWYKKPESPESTPDFTFNMQIIKSNNDIKNYGKEIYKKR